MAGQLNLVAQRLGADVNSFTGRGRPPSHYHTGATVSEMAAPVVSEMDQIVAGGLHPEQFLQPLSRALEADSAQPGRHGGQVPAGARSPAPMGSSVAARQQQIFNTVTGRLPQYLQAPPGPAVMRNAPVAPFTLGYNEQANVSGLEGGGGAPTAGATVTPTGVRRWPGLTSQQLRVFFNQFRWQTNPSRTPVDQPVPRP